MRNEVVDSAKKKPNLNKVQRIVGSIQGFGGGNERRVRWAPPLIQKMSAGTVNPVDKETKRVAFDKDEGTDDEVPYVMLISWMMATLGDQCRHDWHGLVGQYCSKEFENLIDMYLEMGDVDVVSGINKIITKNETTEEYTTKDGNTITVGYCVQVRELKMRYKKMFSRRFELVPSEIGTPKDYVNVCKKCGRFYPRKKEKNKIKEIVDELVKDGKIGCDCKVELCRGVIRNYSYIDA